MCDEGSKGINEQASYAATKLRQLYDKLEYKRQALGSIQNAPKPDKKVNGTKLSINPSSQNKTSSCTHHYSLNKMRHTFQFLIINASNMKEYPPHQIKHYWDVF